MLCALFTGLLLRLLRWEWMKWLMDWNDATYPKVLLGIHSGDRKPVRRRENRNLRSFWRPFVWNSCLLDVFTYVAHGFKCKIKLVSLDPKTFIHYGIQYISIIWYINKNKYTDVISRIYSKFKVKYMETTFNFLDFLEYIFKIKNTYNGILVNAVYGNNHC